MAQFEMGATRAGTVSKREECARAVQAEYEKHYSSDCWPTLDEAESLVDAVLACLSQPNEAMTWAGEDQLDQIAKDHAGYVSGITMDWDNGMAANATLEAMLKAVK